MAWAGKLPPSLSLSAPFYQSLGRTEREEWQAFLQSDDWEGAEAFLTSSRLRGAFNLFMKEKTLGVEARSEEANRVLGVLNDLLVKSGARGSLSLRLRYSVTSDTLLWVDFLQSKPRIILHENVRSPSAYLFKQFVASQRSRIVTPLSPLTHEGGGGSAVRRALPRPPSGLPPSAPPGDRPASHVIGGPSPPPPLSCCPCSTPASLSSGRPSPSTPSNSVAPAQEENSVKREVASGTSPGCPPPPPLPAAAALEVGEEARAETETRAEPLLPPPPPCWLAVIDVANGRYSGSSLLVRAGERFYDVSPGARAQGQVRENFLYVRRLGHNAAKEEGWVLRSALRLQ